jgi:D-beta-D-heptose 7-phosphate kinase/D-beta-D-heptose 1-phosphate adenosyltransferase
MDASWIDKWRGLRILVLGDVMLDRFVYGQVERVSPEAPIPVLRFHSEKAMLGGAGNVARNIVALGGRAVLVGALGADAEGDLVAGPLSAADRIDGRFVRFADHPTTVKTRYVSGGQQIMRLDLERPLRLDAQAVEALCARFAEAVDSAAAVVLSDYAKGVLAPEVIRRVVDLARARGVPVIVDPKSRDVRRYAGATVLTPNAAEAALISGLDCGEDAGAEAAAKIVRDLAEVEAVVLTRGARGMTIWDPAEASGAAAHIATLASEVFDVSGAGDTVAAALSLALAGGASVTMAARIANVAAGVAVGKRGTAAVHARELAKALGGAGESDDPKIVSNETAAAVVADWKAHRLKVGFTNGCFDLLHPGHIGLLRRSRAACDRLVVALNADASVRRLKGENRPLQNQRARSVVIAAIDSVDLVTLFDEDTPMRLIELLKPDYLIKGADYSAATVVGADFVTAYGGKVVLIPLEVGHSTTSIISRANAGTDR